MPMPISVIVTTYNRPDALAATLRGLAAQRYRPFEVIIADDGQQAVDRFERNRDRIDLVMLDVVMPKLGGPAVWEKIRKDARGVSVLFTSGYSEPETQPDVAKGRIITKPYVGDELLRRIRLALDEQAQAKDSA